MGRVVHSDVTLPLRDPELLLADLNREYYSILSVVSEFDQRAIVIKGWSVTVSLAALGIGFQESNFALFGLAAATAAGFWFMDALNKRFQLQYYSRMRDIEVAAYELNNFEIEMGGPAHYQRRKPRKHDPGGPGGAERRHQAGDPPSLKVPVSAPRIDMTWSFGKRGDLSGRDWRTDAPERRFPADVVRLRRRSYWMPQVVFPHVVGVVLGAGLFAWAIYGAPGWEVLSP